MKMWPLFVIVTILCWGAYVPTLHQGQFAFGKNSALRAFLFVGVAYALTSIAVLLYVMVSKSEPMQLNSKGVILSTFAGLLGAVGALGIVFAMKYEGKPIVVAPLVFAGAPIVNTIVSMLFHPPKQSPNVLFYVGIVVAAIGAAITLRFKPV